MQVVQGECYVLEDVEDVFGVACEGEDQFVLDDDLGREDCHGLT
jgi:hypothetical protein